MKNKSDMIYSTLTKNLNAQLSWTSERRMLRMLIKFSTELQNNMRIALQVIKKLRLNWIIMLKIKRFFHMNII